ncbi:MAG: hypothetical protein LW772_05735, partial [Bacteroidetes bacterium]|nr:hypothetical protein [Bacteroidota bacterium]
MTAPLPLGVTFFHRRLPEASYPNEVAKYTNPNIFLSYIAFVYLCIISNFGGPTNEIVQRTQQTR